MTDQELELVLEKLDTYICRYNKLIIKKEKDIFEIQKISKLISTLYYMLRLKYNGVSKL